MRSASSAAPDAGATRLIVNADDFGETVEITRGILDCIDAGVVTSSTLLANMPGTAFALREAARRGRCASFGVHLNLCEGPPLTRASTLTRAGAFLPKRSLALRALAGRLDPDELDAELGAQVARVRDAGVEISHLDSHKHLHHLPGVAEAVIRLAARFGIERVRCLLDADGSGLASAARAPAGWLRARLAECLRVRLHAAGLRHPDRAFSAARLMRLPEERRSFLLRRLEATSEMFCHPGTRAGDREKPGSCSRAAERGFLLSVGFRRLLQRERIRLTTFWEI